MYIYTAKASRGFKIVNSEYQLGAKCHDVNWASGKQALDMTWTCLVWPFLHLSPSCLRELHQDLVVLVGSVNLRWHLGFVGYKLEIHWLWSNSDTAVATLLLRNIGSESFQFQGHRPNRDTSTKAALKLCWATAVANWIWPGRIWFLPP